MDDSSSATSQDVLRQQQGIEISTRELYQLKRNEGMLELRMRLLELRQSYLNQMNTQAALVGGCAVSLLSSGELQIMNEETMCNFHSSALVLAGCLPTEYLVNFLYIVFAVNSFMWALWTIYLSNYLVGKTMIVALHGSGLDDIKSVEPLLQRKMLLIENGFHLSLACLIGAVGCMIAEMNFAVALFLAAPFMLTIGLLARWQTRDISRELAKLNVSDDEPSQRVLPTLGEHLRGVGEYVSRQMPCVGVGVGEHRGGGNVESVAVRTTGAPSARVLV